jgi:single-strand DNA-binding protein
MLNVNKVIIGGTLTADPEVRYTPKGLAISKFNIAINRRIPQEDGTVKSEATFVGITSFGKSAELISQWFKKGKSIFIEGRLHFDQWEDKTTKQKRQQLSVICETFQSPERKSDTPEGATTNIAPASTAPKAPVEGPEDSTPIEHDDVPF